MRKSRENGLFLDIPDEQWNDWHWQVANRVETLEDLKKYITLTPEEEDACRAICEDLGVNYRIRLWVEEGKVTK